MSGHDEGGAINWMMMNVSTCDAEPLERLCFRRVI